MNYWPMDNLSDVIGNAKLFGGGNYSFVFDRFNNPNSAIYFNNGFLEVPQGTYFNSDLSITAWLKLKSYQYYSRIIDFGNGKGIDNVVFGMVDTTKCLFTYSDIFWVQTSELIELDEWYHVAFVLKNTTGFIYVNAIEIVSKIFLASLTILRTKNFIGKSNWYWDPNANAVYDEIKIYSGALTPQKIVSEYTFNKTSSI